MKMVLNLISIFVVIGLTNQNPLVEQVPEATNFPEIRPFFDARRDVRFFVFTNQNPTVGSQIGLSDITTLRTSAYNPALETRILIHGFRNDGDSSFNTILTAAYLRNSNVNVIVVDWGAGSGTINYVGARNRIFSIGPVVAEFLDFLNEHGNMNYNNLIICGYSLGAHIAGLAGKNTRRGRIGAIVGLDPAGPLFDVNNPGTRLDRTDANFVASIHTNGGRSGTGHPISHADFFPNGGTSQPGCRDNGCSHRRSIYLFEESLVMGPFPAFRCASMADISRVCNLQQVFMGANFLDRSIRGIFNLRTNSASPFVIL